jgi:hypothetical protein
MDKAATANAPSHTVVHDKLQAHQAQADEFIAVRR